MTDQIEYYRERAGEYDEVYAKPERQDDLARLHRLLPPLVAGRRVLEIAAGTGYWTHTLAASAAAITATDINLRTLAIARTREYPPGRVSFAEADAYALDRVPGEFDAAFVGFFWSHIPRADLPRFLGGLRDRLAPGVRIIVLDNRFVAGSSQPISRTSEAGDTFQRRTLNDGRGYEIVKNFPAREQFTADVAPVAADIVWTSLRYYWLAEAMLR
ncbi:MAG TPA: class I SAM-dependent methyltransferase [Streptosporangiaceae bacterium]|nr:class I SAM-dependent methyltransferase [Streptosporangiaceae bacterium]